VKPAEGVKRRLTAVHEVVEEQGGRSRSGLKKTK